MKLTKDYVCDGQMGFFECLEAMQNNAESTQRHEKQSSDKLREYEKFGVLNRKIRGQRTFAYYNPNPIYTLDNGKPYIIYSTVAYIGMCDIYVQEFAMYPVIKTYRNPQETVDAYKEYIENFKKDSARAVTQEVSAQLPIQEFYKVDGEWVSESRCKEMRLF